MRVLVVGDSLFTESLAHMLADTAEMRVVGTAVTLDKALAAVARTAPNVIVVAGVSQSTQAVSGPLLSLYPDIPIICADPDRDFVQVITSRRVSARREDLLEVMRGLVKSPDQG